MTNKEAIARIKDHIGVHHIKEDRAIKITQALNMAIEALERTEWHYPSKGELPKKDTLCVVILEQLSDDKKRFTLISRYFEEYGWADFAPSYYKVVAWMPLPDLPKE